ncbi:MAG: cytochrome C [Prochloraceae cyanobacterium]
MHKKPPSQGNFSKLSRQVMQKLRSRKYSTILFLIIFSWSTVLGWGMAVAFDRPIAEIVASIDPVTKPYQLGQQFYVENCSSCHIPLPPEVLPTATWKTILENPQDHYGVELEQLYGPQRLLIWNYLRDFSRSLMAEEPEPQYLARSRYFKAIHPQVEFSEPISVRTCITCHPSADRFNYRIISEKKT